MASIRLTDFGGVAPAFDERRLPDNMAQRAQNVLFDGASVYPMPEDLPASAAGGLSTIELGTGRIQRTFYHRRREDDVPFLYLFRGGEYGVAAGQVNADTHERVYFTEWTGAPASSFLKVISKSTVATVKLAGVPRPTIKPTLSVSANSAPAIAIASISKKAPAEVKTQVPHKLTDGDRVRVSITQSTARPKLADVSGKEFTVSVVDATTIELRGSDMTLTAEWHTIPGAAGTIKKVVEAADVEDRAYVYTVVNAYGEESAPAPVSDVIAVPLNESVTVSVVGLPNNAAFVTQTKIRVYRTVTGFTTGTRYLYVGEASGIGAGGITFVDDKRDVELGEQLQSEDWDTPPPGLRGLVSMPNGMMAAYVGNTLWLCEAYQPHAWPRIYRKTVDAEIVALGVFDNTIVVTTEKSVFTGGASDPASMTLSRAPIDAPCINRNMMVSAGLGVIYPSPDGLVMISGRGEVNLTEGLITKRQWRDMIGSPTKPGLNSAVFWDGKYVAYSHTALTHWIFDPSATPMRISTFIMNGWAGAPCIYPPTDSLVCAQYTTANPNGELIAQFAHPTANRAGWWRSKLFRSNMEPNWGVLQVMADFGTPSGVIRSEKDAVTVRLYPAFINTVPGPDFGKWTGEFHATLFPNTDLGGSQTVVRDPEPVRLPGLGASREWTIDVFIGPNAGRVTEVLLAEHMDELKGA
jgi:hypothetical protein